MTSPGNDKQPNVQVLRNIFSESSHQAILDYLNSYRSYLPSTGDETFVRNGAHNPQFFVKIHQQLTGLASEIFGEPVKPSYCFLSMYKDGGQCPLHFDRPTCKYTIDYLIRQEQKDPWPICISGELSDVEREMHISEGSASPRFLEDSHEVIVNNNWETVLLEPNDAVCYSGSHSWHYRPEVLSGSADLVFFHFVGLNYEGNLN